MTKLIGLGGLLRSGKDATADYLVAEYGFVKMGMSDPLSDALRALNPVVEVVHQVRYSELVDRVGYVEAKKNPEVRRLLQVLGTEVGRNMIDEEVWVNIAGRRIDQHIAEGHPVVMSGIRFENEKTLIHSRGGKLVWIDRPGIIRPVELHASENSVDGSDFDVTIVNDGTLDDLYVKANALVA